MSSFDQLGLSDKVLKVLPELGFEKPSKIQEKAIPILLEGRHDFLGQAQTGTGKTGAFGLPLIDLIDPNLPFTQALVLAPTRELGQQIAEQLGKFSKYHRRLNILPVYGGAPIVNQIKALKASVQHIIIATPGRLIDLVKRKAIHLDEIRTIVLDEADEMLNMGFKEDLETILEYTPEDKMTWLFSATMPRDIRKIASRYMHEPKEVKIAMKSVVNEDIRHEYILVNNRDKTEALTRFMDMIPELRGVVFCRTKRDTQNLSETLLARGYKVDAIHGDLSQAQRDRVMSRFKSHELKVLIATDVAARGIDVNDLTHVFHYTIPDDPAYYTHRSGRTGRAGKKGVSLSFIGGHEQYKMDAFSRKLGINIHLVRVPDTETIMARRVELWCHKMLESKTRPLDPDMMDKVNLLFSNLSKEELLEKIISAELDLLNLGGNKDLNERAQDRKRRGDGSDNRRGRNRGGRDRRRGRGNSFGKKRHRGHSQSDADSGNRPFGKKKSKKKKHRKGR